MSRTHCQPDKDWLRAQAGKTCGLKVPSPTLPRWPLRVSGQERWALNRVLVGVGVLRSGPGLLVLSLHGSPRCPHCPAPAKHGPWPWGSAKPPIDPGEMESRWPVFLSPAQEAAGNGHRLLLLPSRNGISKGSQRPEAGPGSPRSRKDSELHLKELGAAVLEPRGELRGTQRALAPSALRGPGLATLDSARVILGHPCPGHASRIAGCGSSLDSGLSQRQVGPRPRLGPTRRPLLPSGGWPRPSRRSGSWPSTFA